MLGEDEFVQEQTYFLEKHRLHNRSLHGYGTVCGLGVSWDEPGNPQVRVQPGLAVDPKGRTIRVPEEQCGRLNDWLARNREEVETTLGSPPQDLSLYLVLCRLECETDHVPVPGGPCRTLEDSSAPSRIADAFKLTFQTEAPEQVEEEKVREFAELLRTIRISEEPGEFLTEEELESLVRSLRELGSPPDAGSPPEVLSSPAILPPHQKRRVRPEDAPGMFRLAFRVWVTEVRSYLLPGGRNCSGGPPTEDCVLLARLDFPVNVFAGDLKVAGDVAIVEDDRPYLLHTRLLQEYLHPAGARTLADGLITSPPDSGGIDAFEKRISLPPPMAMPVNAEVTRQLLDDRFPALRFDVEGEAAFSFAVPADIDTSSPLRLRLIWAARFPRTITPGRLVPIQLNVTNLMSSPGQPLSSTPIPDSVAIRLSTTRERSGRLIATDFFDLPDPAKTGDNHVTLWLKRENPPGRTPAVNFFLLQTELSYTAKRWGS